MLETKRMTINEFVEWALHPENSDKEYEFVNGETIEKLPGRTSNSMIPLLITAAVYPFCRERHIPCYISGADGAYRVGNHVLVPDFAFKATPMSKDYPDLVAPLWAVEVISPTDKPAAIRAKRLIYTHAGILLWEIYPDTQTVHVYASDKPMQSFSIGDTLDGGDVLPGFTLALKDIFLD